jgi:hypothetical protein
MFEHVFTNSTPRAVANGQDRRQFSVPYVTGFSFTVNEIYRVIQSFSTIFKEIVGVMI